jgi:hypothetical protein
VIQHAIPYAAPGPGCSCTAQPCGGLLPDVECPDHGHRKNPAMAWHVADGERCLQLAGGGHHRGGAA